MNLKIALKAYSFQVIEWNLTKFSVAGNGIFSKNRNKIPRPS